MRSNVPASAAIQSHNALLDSEGLLIFDGSGEGVAPGPVGAEEKRIDVLVAVLGLDQVEDVVVAGIVVEVEVVVIVVVQAGDQAAGAAREEAAQKEAAISTVNTRAGEVSFLSATPSGITRSSSASP